MLLSNNAVIDFLELEQMLLDEVEDPDLANYYALSAFSVRQQDVLAVRLAEIDDE